MGLQYCTYKTVHSCGAFLHNTENGMKKGWNLGRRFPITVMSRCKLNERPVSCIRVVYGGFVYVACTWRVRGEVVATGIRYCVYATVCAYQAGSVFRVPCSVFRVCVCVYRREFSSDINCGYWIQAFLECDFAENGWLNPFGRTVIIKNLEIRR